METQKRKIAEEEATDCRSTVSHKFSVTAHGALIKASQESMRAGKLFDHDNIKAMNNLPEGSTKDIVGCSIGHAQLCIMSPRTAAYEEANATYQSKKWSDRESDDGVVDGVDASLETSDTNMQELGTLHGSVKGKRPGSPEARPSSSDAVLEQSARSTSTRPVLKDVFETRTRRASSDSIGIVGTLKRLLPEMSSISFSRGPSSPALASGSKPKGEIHSDRSKRASLSFFTCDVPWASLMPLPDRTTTPKETIESPGRGGGPRSHPLQHGRECSVKDGGTHNIFHPAEASFLSPHTTRNQPLLKRAASDNSLFLRQELDQIRTHDDAEKWANVSEQINSRLKAITDSFQDSAINRIPRIPNVGLSSLSSFRTSLSRSNSIAARLCRNHDSVSSQENAPNKDISTQKPPACDPVKQTKHAHPCLNQALSELTGDVVVLGGYRGSILRSAKPPHKQLWAPVKVGMNLRRVDLEVGLHPEDEERMTDTIVPSGVLSHFGPVDICRRLLKHLEKSSRARQDQLRVHNYGYDWRLSPHLLSRRLISFLESLECNQRDGKDPGRGAVVIAHSLGGMITRHAVNQRPDLFAGVVYAGVPQHCVNILGPFRNGDDVLLSSRVLTAQVNFTMRTSFALLPESGRCFINKTTGERYDVDFFDVKSWEQYCLSPCVSTAPIARLDGRKSIIGSLSETLPTFPLTSNSKRNATVRNDNQPSREAQSSIHDGIDAVREGTRNPVQAVYETRSASRAQGLEPSMRSPAMTAQRQSVATACTIPRAEALAYLERTLTEVRRFKEALAFNPSHQVADVYPPIAVLYSNNVPTVFAARVDNREAIKFSDAYDHLAFAAGDGVVLAKAARPPVGYKVVKGGLIRSERGHIGLLGDLEAVGRCLGAISDARRKGVGLGKFAKTGETQC